MKSTIPTRISVRPSKIWGVLHNSRRLTLHATIYTWAAEQMQPGWVLDLGCEYGFGSLLIAETNPNLQVLGMDLDFSALGYSQDVPCKEKIPWINASGHKLPIVAESFSGIYLINLLHLMEDTATVLSETRRVLKSNGVAILSIPQNDSQEIGQSRSPFIKQLELEINDLFSEVIYPNKICGQLPSFPPQTFLLDQQASPWIALCRKK
jgi:ubiquinone/menaquinone biosynthesis C-methylase UbiE